MALVRRILDGGKWVEAPLGPDGTKHLIKGTEHPRTRINGETTTDRAQELLGLTAEQLKLLVQEKKLEWPEPNRIKTFMAGMWRFLPPHISNHPIAILSEDTQYPWRQAEVTIETGVALDSFAFRNHDLSLLGQLASVRPSGGHPLRGLTVALPHDSSATALDPAALAAVEAYADTLGIRWGSEALEPTRPGRLHRYLGTPVLRATVEPGTSTLELDVGLCDPLPVDVSHVRIMAGALRATADYTNAIQSPATPAA